MKIPQNEVRGGNHMPKRNIVILDGAASGDKDLSPILSVLSDVLKARWCSSRDLSPARNETGPLPRLLWLLGQDTWHVCGSGCRPRDRQSNCPE